MSRRILCPVHEEQTPSCQLYEDGYFCFGCGASGPLSDIGLERSSVKKEPKYVEDIKASIKYIRSLPVSTLRGLELPADASGFYIVWPDGSYYKRRYFEPGNGPKYRGPTGIPKPIFIAKQAGSDTAIVVEGELNALAIAKAVKCDVISPGGTGDFVSNRFEKDLREYTKYRRIIVIVDADSAGIKAAISLATELRKHLGCVLTKAMAPDANEVLAKDGREKLKETLQGMGLSEQV